ncbi:hypothetical protein ACGFLT_18245 [Micromonospora chalcea]
MATKGPGFSHFAELADRATTTAKWRQRSARHPATSPNWRAGPTTTPPRAGPTTTLSRAGPTTTLSRAGPKTTLSRAGPTTTLSRAGPATAPPWAGLVDGQAVGSPHALRLTVV